MEALVDSFHCLKCKILGVFYSIFDIIDHFNECPAKFWVFFVELHLLFAFLHLIGVMLRGFLNLAFLAREAIEG